jgi:predicted RNA-binding protein with PUA-like domain
LKLKVKRGVSGIANVFGLGLSIGSMNYWIVKQEPEDYSWSDFVADGKTAWTGVRNYQARNNLRAMKAGDKVLFYHSGEQKSVVGIARVDKPAYADPTAKEGDWVAVDLRPEQPLPNPVTLQTIKKDAVLKNIVLARNSRLSVSPLEQPQFARILQIAQNGGA